MNMRLDWVPPGEEEVASVEPPPVKQSRPRVRDSVVPNELAYCHGLIETWAPLGNGWYQCEHCGHEKKLVGTS